MHQAFQVGLDSSEVVFLSGYDIIACLHRSLLLDVLCLNSRGAQALVFGRASAGTIQRTSRALLLNAAAAARGLCLNQMQQTAADHSIVTVVLDATMNLTFE